MKTKKYVAGPTARRRRMSMGSMEEGLSLEACRNKKEKKESSIGSMQVNKEEFRLGADDNKKVNRIDGCRRRRRHRL